MLTTFTVTNTADSGANSLRWAITQSDGTAGPNIINFKINSTGVQTVSVLSPLPTITKPVAIDGTSQTGYAGSPVVVLSGLSAGASAVGLSFTATAIGSTLKGLAVDSFASGGVLFSGGSNDVVSADYIGISAAGAGTSSSGNGTFGVAIEGGATGVTITGDVISNNSNYGVEVTGSLTSANLIADDFIGTDVSGSVAAPNLAVGVYITGGASANTVGGLTLGSADVISANAQDGVEIAGASNNVVEGDFIGTAVGGAASLPNGTGVFLTGGASQNTIGGLTAAARDVISANTNQGVWISNSNSNVVEGNYIGVSASGALALGNGQGVLVQNSATTQVTTGNTIGGTSSSARNVISANLSEGVSVSTAAGTVIEGNYIGLNAAGNAGFITGSGAYAQTTGISVTTASGTSIGGTVAGAGNAVSASQLDGIDIGDSANTLIAGDEIGTDPSGIVTAGEARANLNNGASGIVLAGATGVTIGGTTATARDVISNNFDNGLVISASTSVLVQGDYIGTDTSGEVGVDNGNIGVFITPGSATVTIGGSTSGAGDVISSNGAGGIAVSGASSVLIAGDKIGTDLTGEHALANDVFGVSLSAATGVTIGGTTAAARNIISSNFGVGIEIATSAGCVVQGNDIGLDAAGLAPMGNDGDGVLIEQSASVTIGGTSAVDRNIISANAQSGVEIDASSNNLVDGNYIGTDSTGTTAFDGANPLGNQLYGVVIDASSVANTIAGSTTAPAVVAGNLNIGVLITGPGTIGNLVEGTLIGTNTAGSAALPNESHGLVITNGASSNTIGGNSAAARDIISGNLYNGVALSGTATTANVVEGDYIGTNAAGTAALGNGASGVFFSASPGNTIGGTAAGAGNVISGNDTDGVWITSGASGEVIEGDYIGTSSTGAQAVSNGNVGVVIDSGASSNTVLANTISANLYEGVLVTGTGTDNNTISSNFIGTDAAGTAVLQSPGQNFSNDVGVEISNGAYATSVGTNVIAGNWTGSRSTARRRTTGWFGTTSAPT